MKKRNLFCYMLMLAGLLTACTEKETPGGVKYQVIKKGDGVEPAFGQFLVMNIILKDAKDSVWFNSSKDLGSSVVVAVPDASMVKNEGEYGVFKVLTKGDSVSFKLPAEIVFSRAMGRSVPKNVDPKSLFQFNVGLQDVWTPDQANEFKERKMAEGERARAKNDLETITQYLTAKNINNTVTDSSGLVYVVTKQGMGEKAKSGQTAYIHYAGFLLDGTIFDTSLASVAKANNINNGGRNEPYPVVVNTGAVIRGWDQMIMLMNKGMKVTVYVPSALAYGSQSPGAGIPPNSILVFDMELVDIK